MGDVGLGDVVAIWGCGAPLHRMSSRFCCQGQSGAITLRVSHRMGTPWAHCALQPGDVGPKFAGPVCLLPWCHDVIAEQFPERLSTCSLCVTLP